MLPQHAGDTQRAADEVGAGSHHQHEHDNLSEDAHNLSYEHDHDDHDPDFTDEDSMTGIGSDATDSLASDAEGAREKKKKLSMWIGRGVTCLVGVWFVCLVLTLCLEVTKVVGSCCCFPLKAAMKWSSGGERAPLREGGTGILYAEGEGSWVGSQWADGRMRLWEDAREDRAPALTENLWVLPSFGAGWTPAQIRDLRARMEKAKTARERSDIVNKEGVRPVAELGESEGGEGEAQDDSAVPERLVQGKEGVTRWVQYFFRSPAYIAAGATWAYGAVFRWKRGDELEGCGDWARSWEGIYRRKAGKLARARRDLSQAASRLKEARKKFLLFTLGGNQDLIEAMNAAWDAWVRCALARRERNMLSNGLPRARFEELRRTLASAISRQETEFPDAGGDLCPMPEEGGEYPSGSVGGGGVPLLPDATDLPVGGGSSSTVPQFPDSGIV